MVRRPTEAPWLSTITEARSRAQKQGNYSDVYSSETEVDSEAPGHDDESIFRTFELIKPLDHRKRKSAGQSSARKSRDLGEAMRHQFGEIIGERQLNRVGARSKDLTVTLGKPRRGKDGEWECPFRITGLGIQCGYGVDGIQALTTALDGIRVMLERSAQRFSWLGGEPGYTGFDRFVTTSLGEKFNKRLNLIIDREIAKFVYLLERTHQKRKTTTRKKSCSRLPSRGRWMGGWKKKFFICG